MRKGLVWWHRWFGLIGGLWLLLIAATGSVLVFYDELDSALAPEFHSAVSSTAQALPLDRLAAAGRRAVPSGFDLTYLRQPHGEGGVAIAYFAPRPGSGVTGFPQVAIDPGDGRVQGVRDIEAVRIDRLHVMDFIYTLHYSLHGGETVTLLLGILAALWFIDHGPAVVLSLPNLPRWRESFAVPRRAQGHKLHTRLHRALGLWLLPVTAMLAFSGVYFNWRPAYNVVVIGALGPRIETAAAPAAAAAADAPPLGFGAAAAIAGRAGATRIDGIGYDAQSHRYSVGAHDPRDLDGNGGRAVTIDAISGKILGDRHRTQGNAADIVDAWQYPLHSGKALGWPGRIIILIAGLATCAFVITGLLIWARKRNARGRRSPLPARARPPGLRPAE